MKKYIFSLCFSLSVSIASATAFCQHTINVNNNFSIVIYFQDIFESEVTAGLYFDLIVWAKNAENELANVNGSVYIEYLSDYESTLMWVSKGDTSDVAYRFFYDAERKGVKIIEYTNVNTEYTDDFIIKEEYFLAGTKKITEAIIARLNADFQTNGRYDNLNSVELFVKNNKENIAKPKYRQAMIHSDYIYINKEDLMKSIEKKQGYFIETIIIKRRKAHKIVDVDSSGCG